MKVKHISNNRSHHQVLTTLIRLENKVAYFKNTANKCKGAKERTANTTWLKTAVL